MTSLLSPAGVKARLSILIYHRVLPIKDPLFPNELDAGEFEAQMRSLMGAFQFMPLDEAVTALQRGTLPARAASITFDDGYADNAEIALPILRRLGLPATFFVATGFLDGGRMWNDTVIELVRAAPASLLDLTPLQLGTVDLCTIDNRQQAIPALLARLKYLPMSERLQTVERMRDLLAVELPANLMMTSAQVRSLHSAGMGVGGHTVNHPILATLENAAAEAEIANGKEALEGIIGAPVRLFAYPNGKPDKDYRYDHLAIVRKLGFSAAVSTAWGAACNASDIYQLPRFTPWDTSEFKFMLRMAKNLRVREQTVKN